VDLPVSPLPNLTVIDLLCDSESVLQQFFEENPLYFVCVYGTPAPATEAHEEVHGEVPTGWAFTHKYVFGYEEPSGKLVAMGNVISDLLARGVWHIGTFIVATTRHGTGDARILYASIEQWCKRGGARWIRLGVVEGNTRAEAFWARCGYTQVAKREGIVMGQRTNVILVMAKPLFGQSLGEYYSLVERDRPAPTNLA
jgi:GNAT superfamily N-acetyltransferase